MGKLYQLSERSHPRGCPGVDLVTSPSNEICSGADLRNLIDSWIVPKLIDDWFGRSDADLNATTEEDNGEQS